MFQSMAAIQHVELADFSHIGHAGYYVWVGALFYIEESRPEPLKRIRAVRPTTNDQDGVYAPFHMPRPVRVAVTSTIQAVRLAATVMFEETETTEAA